MTRDITGEETLSEVYEMVLDDPRYKNLDLIGQELRRVEIYANKRIITDDVTVAMVNIALVAYRTGIAPAIQINESLFLNRLFQIELPYSLSIRGLIEVAGQVHKAAKTIKQHRANASDLRRASERLIRRFARAGGGGHNVMTNVQSLRKAIENIEEHYDELSNYAHGDFSAHVLARSLSYFSNLRGNESPVITRYDELLSALWSVLLDDLNFIRSVLRPLAARVDPNEGDCIGADIAHQLNSKSE